MTGATFTCSRSRHRAAIKRDTVSAPPSINIRRIPAPAQRRDDSGRRNVSVLRRQGDDFNAGGRCGLRAVRRDQQTANAVVGKQFCLGSQASFRIDHGTRGLRTGDMPDRQLRVIGQRRSNADHDNIDQRAEPVQMFDTGRTVDELRVTRRRRDPTIERLADLPDNHEIIHHPVAQRPEQISAQACDRCCCPPRKCSTKLSHVSEEANLRVGKLLSCTVNSVLASYQMILSASRS